MIIQFVLPRKPPDTLTRAATDRAAVFLGAIFMLLRVASEVGGVLDGDVAAWVSTVVPLASKGRRLINGCRWGVGRRAGEGVQGEGRSREGWRLIVEASEVVNMWSAA